MESKPKTLISIAADYGLILGALFCLTFFAALYALRWPALSFVTLAGFIGVPVTVFIMLKRTWIKSLHTMPFSAMWTQGIAAAAGGAIILALATYIFLKWIQPDLLIDALERQVKAWEAVGSIDATHNAKALKFMIENGSIPHPSEIAIQLACLVIFTCSALSMVLSLVTRIVYRHSKL